nr:fibronectin type III-like domain-contianing protein [Elizabethkingia anophelis]
MEIPDTGDLKHVMIEVLVKEHKFLDEKMNWIIKKGTYRIMIGNSSKNLPKTKYRNRVVALK